MKRFIILLSILSILSQSCATIYGGAITQCQKTRPKKGEPTRKLRAFALTCDIVIGLFLFEIPTIIDFATRAIYKPCEYLPIKNSTPNNNQLENSQPISQEQPETKRVYTPAKGTTSYLDYKNGFRGLKFGTSIDSIAGMSLITDTAESKKNNGNTIYYLNTTDTLSIGNYELKSIVYGFYKGKLSSIKIDTRGYKSSRGILMILKDLYGSGYQSNQYIEHYSWFGSKVYLAYDENSITNNAVIYFWSEKLKKQQEYDEKQMRKKAESGF